MSVDLEFVLKYLLSSELGRELSIEILKTEPSEGKLFVKVDGRDVALEFPQCKFGEEEKFLKCVSKAVSRDERSLQRVVEVIERALGSTSS